MSNKTLIFKKIPTGLPVPGEHIAVEARPFDKSAPPPPGGLTLELQCASFDPYQRGRMRDPSVKSYSPAFGVGEPVSNDAIGRVLASDAPGFAAGDLVVAFVPTAQYARVEKPMMGRVRKVHNPHGLEEGLFLGALGMPGLTAYSSLYRIGCPKAGETIFVSSAAGAVGQVVGQLAKREGLRVVGSVGSDEKLDFIEKELGFDAGFNYKKEKPADALPRLCPEGVDIYFESVGGETLDAVLVNMNNHGRIIACGMITGYNESAQDRYGIKNILEVVSRRIKMEGFLVGDPGFGPAYYEEHQKNIQNWLADGSFKAKLHITEGIDNAAEGFVGMLEGRNFGKAILRI